MSSPKLHLHQRARVAALARRRPPDDPDLASARADLTEANLAAYIEGVASGMAPLTPEARTRLAIMLLTPSTDTAA